MSDVMDVVEPEHIGEYVAGVMHDKAVMDAMRGAVARGIKDWFLNYATVGVERCNDLPSVDDDLRISVVESDGGRVVAQSPSIAEMLEEHRKWTQDIDEARVEAARYRRLAEKISSMADRLEAFSDARGAIEDRHGSMS